MSRAKAHNLCNILNMRGLFIHVQEGLVKQVQNLHVLPPFLHLLLQLPYLRLDDLPEDTENWLAREDLDRTEKVTSGSLGKTGANHERTSAAFAPLFKDGDVSIEYLLFIVG